MDTLFIIGGSGLVGSKVAAAAKGTYRVVATYRDVAPKIEGVEFVKMRKEVLDESLPLMRQVKPAAVIDTAALHNVDKCEEDRDLAWQVNAGSTGTLAQAATDLGARYLFISTDFVFDGTKGNYAEDDVARPVNYYGETKLAGERATLAASADHLVVRPSVVYGWDDTRLNFATWLLTSLRDKKSVNIVTDWIGSPTLADSLAQALVKLLAAPSGGVYHLAGKDAMSRFDFSVRLAKAFRQDTSLVKPVTSADMKMKAPRPPNSSLANTKAKRLGLQTLGADEGIAFMVGQRTLESFVTPQRFKS